MISAVIYYDDDKISISSAKAKAVGTTFSPGIYLANIRNEKLTIRQVKFSELHEPFTSTESQEIRDTVAAFFKDGIKEVVNKLGFIHKLGILVYGRAGTGKTSLLNYIANEMIKEQGAIVLACENHNAMRGALDLAPKIREIQSNPIIFIADEFERFAQDVEAEMKTLLDGNNSIENMLFLASTNHIDKIPKTLSERPSRFKICREIYGITDKDTMRNIIHSMSNKKTPPLFTEDEVEAIVKEINSTTLDELKHKALEKITSIYIKSSPKAIGFMNQK